MPLALITGGAVRVGAAFARALAADGWRVVIHYNRSAADAEALAAELNGHAIGADLEDPQAVAALIPEVIARHGKLDALINNASRFRFDSLRSMTPDSWRQGLATNLEAPVALAQAFARSDPPAGASIVNMLDHKIAALNTDFFSYTIAKLALAGATRLLALALEGRIRVNGIAPGLTLPSEKLTGEAFERAWRATPLGRSSTPEELADALRLILATPSLNGEVLILDGGDHLRGRARDVSADPAYVP